MCIGMNTLPKKDVNQGLLFRWHPIERNNEIGKLEVGKFAQYYALVTNVLIESLEIQIATA